MENNQPIVIKKNKVIAGGHHGGSWKVAYADFVTAMMAFFLLMWLLGSTTEGQRSAISDFFQNPSLVISDSGGSPTPVNMGGGMDAPQQPDVKTQEHKEMATKQLGMQENVQIANQQLGMAELEKQRFEHMLEDLRQAIESSQSLNAFKDQLLLDITQEGLRIQIVDKEQRSMFDLGSAALKGYTRNILSELAQFITKLPNKVSITGHTDARQYSQLNSYTNWELSADRANAARRQLIMGGMDAEKVIRVEGLASRVLLDKQDPNNPSNRRIGIVILNSEAEKDILASEETYSVDLSSGSITTLPARDTTAGEPANAAAPAAPAPATPTPAPAAAPPPAAAPAAAPAPAAPPATLPRQLPDRGGTQEEPASPISRPGSGFINLPPLPSPGAR